MPSPKVQSPLDKSKVKEYITRRIQKGVAPSVIVAEVNGHFDIQTTTDSLRRFRQRHGLDSNAAPAPKVKETAAPKKTSKPTFRHAIMGDEDEKCITVFFPGEMPLIATNKSHANYEEIEKKAKAGDPSVKDLFDPGIVLDKKFKKVSERVSVRDGKIYFDGDPQDDALTEHLVRCLNEGVKNYMPVVLFLEKLQTNQNEHSRKQLWGWLKKAGMSITTKGDIIGYKGVKSGPNNTRVSREKGTAIVNGEEVINQQIPYPEGATIEMPRSAVQHNPAVGCSTGLHVGTHNYARNFSRDVLEVRVNPRDVVSVPTECDEQKMRVSRLTVVKPVDRAYTAPIVDAHKVA